MHATGSFAAQSTFIHCPEDDEESIAMQSPKFFFGNPEQARHLPFRIIADRLRIACQDSSSHNPSLFHRPIQICHPSELTLQERRRSLLLWRLPGDE